MTAYAVNICDLLELSRVDKILHMLVVQHVDENDVVEAEPGQIVGTGHAARIACGEEQARAIIEVARKKYKRHQLRFYESKTGDGGWRRL